MSFYDLTKDNVLSANELFKYRLKRDGSVPSKGGQKAFEPDDSWIHAKALESLMQERTKILSEQRVEKLKSLVQGVWEEQKRLVNLSKPGKFWAHMGFTDKRRNWLYPEEALFLMETNTLEVYCDGLPLSIQEAYGKFIGPDLSVEEYQVFAHLRRLGYVVLRQEAQLEITPYEKQLNLDKYMSKQNRRERKEKILAQRKTQETNKPIETSIDDEKPSPSTAQSPLTHGMDTELTHLAQQQIKGGNSSEISSADDRKEHPTLELSKADVGDGDGEQNDKPGESSSTSTRCSLHTKRSLPNDEDLLETGSEKKAKKDEPCGGNPEVNSPLQPEWSSSDDQPHMSWYVDSAWSQCFQKSLPQSTSDHTIDGDAVRESQVNPGDDTQSLPNESFPFPTIANKSVLSLPQPWSKLLPHNVVVNEEYNDILIFNVTEYRKEFPLEVEVEKSEREKEREDRIRNLKFSFADWTKKPSIKASNWTEYNEKVKIAMRTMSAHTPVDHLWEGDVTPLVRPQDAWSKRTILDRLDIIKTADNETLLPNQDCMVDLKVSYSVHLPDSRFKKSLPGTPDHRVCVVKCCAEPPNLAEVQEVWSRFKDDVPLHCAVVDSGEIAFYMFDNTFNLEILPQ